MTVKIDFYSKPVWNGLAPEKSRMSDEFFPVQHKKIKINDIKICHLHLQTA